MLLSSVHTGIMARTAVLKSPSLDPGMSYIARQLRFLMVASIVSAIFANATVSGLAIESYPTPLTSIRSTTPHANYATPPAITNPYRSVETLAHVSITSASADEQDLLAPPTDYLNAGLLDYASYVPGAPYPFHSGFEPITETSSSTIHTTDIASITIAAGAPPRDPHRHALTMRPPPKARPIVS